MNEDDKARDPEAKPDAETAAPSTPEAEFAASESDQPVEANRERQPTEEPAPAASPEPAPASMANAPEAVAAAAAAATDAPRRRVWSDEGDAPFEDGADARALKGDKPPSRLRDDGKAAPKTAKTEKDDGNELVEIVKTVVFALLIAFVLRVLLFQPFTIPSASMEPNLYEGDYIVVSKWAYGYSKYSSGLPINLPLGEGRVFGRAPARGDIAVFKLPRDNRTDYIKRVIGLPGDRVQMIQNRLHINGQPVDDVVVGRAEVADMFGARPVTRLRETLPGGKSFVIQDFGAGGDLDDTPVYEVPQGMYFMMGDNRDNSIDSRVEQSSGVGLVPEQNLVGKAEIIMFSWRPGASFLNPVSWFANVRPSRFFTVLD